MSKENLFSCDTHFKLKVNGFSDKIFCCSFLLVKKFNKVGLPTNLQKIRPFTFHLKCVWWYPLNKIKFFTAYTNSGIKIVQNCHTKINILWFSLKKLPIKTQDKKMAFF